MVAKYGMSDAIGPVVYDNQSGEVFLGRDYGRVNNYSEDTSSRIDAEIERILRNSYSETEKILKDHFDKLELVAKALFENEKINGEQFVALMENGELPAEEPVINAEEAVAEPSATDEVVETDAETATETTTETTTEE